jgi:6-phosphogluconolactonase (cycloisomerase 2 family)
MFGACYGAETQVYAIDAARGTLTPAGSTASVYSYQMVFTPSGNFAFSAEALLPGTGTPSGVLGFRVDAQTGALLPFAGNPFAGGTNPAAIAIDPTARFVYAANSGSDDMSAFTLDSAGASLAPIAGSPYATGGTSPVTIAIDPSGRFVYVVNSASANVSAFAIDPASGALSPLPGSPFMTGSAPNSIAFDPSGRFAYVANYADNTVSEFAIDAQSGVLTAIPGSPLATAAGPAITIK